MAKVLRFESHAERLRNAEVAQGEQLLLALDAEGLLTDTGAARRVMSDEADKLYHIAAKWRFVMLGRQEAHQLDVWLHSGGSKRPALASRVLLHCEINSDMRSGEVTVSRQELADTLGALPRHVSSCLSDLERGGALRRVRDGRSVRVFLNSRLATGLKGQQRAEAQADAPLLAVIDGGAAEPSPAS